MVRLSILLALGCALLVAAPARAAAPFDTRHFVAAIHDAAVPQADDVDTHLFALADGNAQLKWRDASRQQLLVAAVMTLDSYTRYYSGPSGTTPPTRPTVWVTLAPQLQKWCKAYAKQRAQGKRGLNVRKRIVQRLGLSPTIPYAKVVQLWVDRSNVLRPCPDPGTADTRCDLQMATPAPVVKGVADFPAFFSGLFVNAYTPTGAPWTRLGYTYDWGQKRKFGFSEYMLTTSTAYEVESAASVAQYCA